LRRENPSVAVTPPIRMREGEEITEEAVTTTLRRAIKSFSSIQAHDGHWPGEFSGPTFLLPFVVSYLFFL